MSFTPSPRASQTPLSPPLLRVGLEGLDGRISSIRVGKERNLGFSLDWDQVYQRAVAAAVEKSGHSAGCLCPSCIKCRDASEEETMADLVTAEIAKRAGGNMGSPAAGGQAMRLMYDGAVELDRIRRERIHAQEWERVAGRIVCADCKRVGDKGSSRWFVRRGAESPKVVLCEGCFTGAWFVIGSDTNLSVAIDEFVVTSSVVGMEHISAEGLPPGDA